MSEPLNRDAGSVPAEPAFPGQIADVFLIQAREARDAWATKVMAEDLPSAEHYYQEAVLKAQLSMADSLGFIAASLMNIEEYLGRMTP